MKEITIADKTFELYISHAEIQHTVLCLAEAINNTNRGKELVVVGILNGSFMFLSDLVKNLSETINITVTFVKVSSYEGGIESKGAAKSLIGLDIDIKDKNVIVIEDILDTLVTINFVTTALCRENPATLKVVSLLSKQPLTDAIIGKKIKDEFVVGYGMDYLGQGRHYKDIYKLKK